MRRIHCPGRGAWQNIGKFSARICARYIVHADKYDKTLEHLAPEYAPDTVSKWKSTVKHCNCVRYIVHADEYGKLSGGLIHNQKTGGVEVCLSQTPYHYHRFRKVEHLQITKLP